MAKKQHWQEKIRRRQKALFLAACGVWWFCAS